MARYHYSETKVTHFPGNSSDWTKALCGRTTSPRHLDDETPNCPRCIAEQARMDAMQRAHTKDWLDANFPNRTEVTL